MNIYVGPGGPSTSLSWADLVELLSSSFSSILPSLLSLLRMFNTPFQQLIEADSTVSSWFVTAISWVLDIFGIEFLSLTPLEFALGSALQFVIIFTIYRYVKQ